MVEEWKICSSYTMFRNMIEPSIKVVLIKDGNIGLDGYIGTWILRIYRIYQIYIGYIKNISVAIFT